MWISEDFLAFLKSLALPLVITFAGLLIALLVDGIKQRIDESGISNLLQIIQVSIAIILTACISPIAIEALREIYHRSNILLTLVIAISWAIVPILWIISKVRQTKGTGRSYDL